MRKSTTSKADAANDSSQQSAGKASSQRWAAGLDALSKAQAEGAKVFGALLKQGQGLQQRTKQAAAETAAVARDVAAAKAREMQQFAGGTIDRLEQVFEERVARALSRMGFYTQKDLEKLTERIDALSEAVNSLLQATRNGAAAPAAKPRATKRAKTAKPAKPAKTAKRAKSVKAAASVDKAAAPTKKPRAKKSAA
jgi:poly(hydroxyalkanoate) granule-associated protein